MNPCINLHNLTVSYQKHPAVHHINVSIPQGKTTAIIGPNGAGKSTLLKAIMGLVVPDHGAVSVNVDRCLLSYLPQQTNIERNIPLSVAELVATGFSAQAGMFRCIGRNQQDEIIQALEYVGLGGFEDRSISALSGGQFQRVLFARIIVQKAMLILLDEPFNAVDAKTVLDLCGLIRSWQKEGKTVIAVIHDFHVVQAFFSHTMVLARELIAFGPTQTVLTEANINAAYSTLLNWNDKGDWCTVPNDLSCSETESSCTKS